jgi:hypothetical protein
MRWMARYYYYYYIIRAYSSTSMDVATKDNGRTTSCMAMGSTLTKTAVNTSDPIRRIKKMYNYNSYKKGFGIYTWGDGRIYEGFWCEGKQHGNGKYTSADGQVKHG